MNEYKIVWATFVEVHLEDEYNWWISRGAHLNTIILALICAFSLNILELVSNLWRTVRFEGQECLYRKTAI